MTSERVDTRGNNLTPGKYTFVVADVPVKGEFKPGANYYHFKFMVYDKDRTVSFEDKIPVWMAGELLRAIGAVEIETGVFDWDKEMSVGVKFDGEIVMEMSVSKKDGKTYQNARLKFPVALPGFPRDPNVKPSNADEENVPF